MKLKIRKEKKARTNSIAARVPMDLIEKLDKLCYEHRYSRSEMIANILDDWFANHADIELVESEE